MWIGINMNPWFGVNHDILSFIYLKQSLGQGPASAFLSCNAGSCYQASLLYVWMLTGINMTPWFGAVNYDTLP